ncbi:MAG: T9SS type A sorting domain-containing protein [archaeon]
MSLKSRLKSAKTNIGLLVTGLALAFNLNTANAQSIEGHINDSGSYPRDPIADAMVDAPGLGQDYTDLDGFYEIPGSSVPIGPIIHPQAGRQIRYEIFDVMGRVIKRFEGDPLENKVNDLSSGIYFIQRNDNIGEGIQRIIVLNQNNVIRGNIQYNVRYQPIMSLNSVNNTNNSSKAGVKEVNGTDTDYIFTVSDDNIPEFIGSFYDYIDTLAVDTSITKDVRLIPQFTIGTQYYDELLDLFKDLETFPSGNCFIVNYGEYPNNSLTPYPQRVYLNAPQAQQYCGSNWQLYINTERAALDSMNNKTGLDLFREVSTPDSANISLNYITTGNSNWSPNYQNIGGNYYFVGGVLNLKSNYPNFINIYRTFCHELGIHGLGMEGHSDDPDYISYAPVQAFDFQPEEIETMQNHVLQYPYYVTGPGYLYNFVEE